MRRIHRNRCLAALGRLIVVFALGVTTAPVYAQEKKSPLLFVDTDTVTIQGRGEATFGGQAFMGSWFNLLARPLPSYNPNRQWAEGWISPGIDASFYPSDHVEVYSGLSLGLSATRGSDLLAQNNKAAVLLENAFAGVKTSNPATAWNVDLSTGQQPYKIGTGMLVGNGAGNGFERGAYFLGPRNAWSNASVGRFTYNGWKVEAFYLDPNEVKTFDTHTTMAGGVIEYRWDNNTFAGLSYIRVLNSTQAYLLFTSPFSIPNGRDGLEALQGYARLDGSRIGIPDAWARGEFALERNSRIDMAAYAYYAEAGYRFAKARFAPTLSYSYATFSGDNPNTPRYERFDPLFYEFYNNSNSNDPNTWSFGINSAFAFRNANVNFNRLSLQLSTTESDKLTFQYIHTRANELSSLVLGPLTNTTNPILSGLNINITLASHHLADEINGQWTHNFKPNVQGTVWASLAVPGAGLRSLPNAQAEPWASVGLTLAMWIPVE